MRDGIQTGTENNNHLPYLRERAPIPCIGIQNPSEERHGRVLFIEMCEHQTDTDDSGETSCKQRGWCDMKVLLVNPPSPYLDNDAAYPPMGLMYVAAALEKEGCSVEIIDMAGNRPSPLYNIDYDLVGFTCVTPNVNIVRSLIETVPSDIPVMVGGAHPTFVPEDALGHIQIEGEFESVARHIVADVSTGTTDYRYFGLPVLPCDIPIPARHLVDLHRYKPGGENATPIYTSRGCNFNCAFCSGFSKYRAIPFSNTKAELAQCVDAGFNNLVIGDDNFFIDKTHAFEILDHIRDTYPDIRLRINTDARGITNEVVRRAKEAGCVSISMGIESGSQMMLNRMNKAATVKKNAESIRLVREHGVEVKTYFMVNFPGETEQTVQATLDFAEKIKPDKWLLSSFAPLPGSDVWDRPEHYGITSVSRNWNDYYLVGKGGMFQPSFETAYLTHQKQTELHDMMFNGLKEVLG
jgi:radical SAM superfamily enzyme YgiQ (UPF0313 family)